MDEKIGIIKRISEREHLNVVSLAKVQDDEYKKLKELNDGIFNKYLPS